MTRVAAEPDRMRQAASALGRARAALEGAQSAAARVVVPAHPFGLRVQIETEIRAAGAVATHAGREADRLRAELALRTLLAERADRSGRDWSPRPGSGKLTTEGVLQGLIGDLVGGLLSGLSHFAERYAKLWKVGLLVSIRVQTVVSRATVVLGDGRRVVLSASTRASRMIVSTVRATASRLPLAGLVRRAGRGLSVLGHADNAIGVYRAFQTTGPHRNAAIGGASGKWAGGSAGAAMGAKGGALIGATVGGPLGAAVGAGVGAAIGALAGSEAGKRAGEFLGSKAKGVGNFVKRLF